MVADYWANKQAISWSPKFLILEIERDHKKRLRKKKVNLIKSTISIVEFFWLLMCDNRQTNNSSELPTTTTTDHKIARNVNQSNFWFLNDLLRTYWMRLSMSRGTSRSHCLRNWMRSTSQSIIRMSTHWCCCGRTPRTWTRKRNFHLNLTW